MNLLGLTIARTKTLELQAKQSRSLVGVAGSRGWWWPIIHEMTTGGWQRNDEVSVDTALTNPTLFAVVTLIAKDIAKLRPRLVERQASGIWVEVDSAPFAPVLRAPNHYQNWIEFTEWYLLSKLVAGNTYALKARDGRNMVRALYVLDPYRVRPLVSPDGSVFYELPADELTGLPRPLAVPAREIIHDVMVPLFHPLCGVSPIYAAGYPAMQGLNIRNKSDKFFSNGSRPGGVLTAPGPITNENAAELKQYWETNFSGDNIGKIAVLGDGLKYEAMAMTAEQAELVAQLHMSDEDIAKTYHMPRHKVGIGPDPTYNNIDALNRIYYSDCLQYHIEKYELKLDYGLEVVNVADRTLGIELDRAALFEMDTAARADAATKAINAGMSPNEVRLRYWDLGPVAGGEVPVMQRQNWPINILGSDTPPPPAPPPEPGPPPEPAPEPEEEKAFEMGAVLLAVNAKVAALRQATQ